MPNNSNVATTREAIDAMQKAAAQYQPLMVQIPYDKLTPEQISAYANGHPQMQVPVQIVAPEQQPQQQNQGEEGIGFWTGLAIFGAGLAIGALIATPDDDPMQMTMTQQQANQFKQF